MNHLARHMSIMNSVYLLAIIATPIDHAHCRPCVFSAHVHKLPGIDCQTYVYTAALRPVILSYPPTVPLFHHCARFFTAFLGTNLPLDLIIFSYFYQICKNVPLLDQKSRFFKDFVPLFASGRLVGMYYDHTCMQGKCQVHVGYVLCRALVVKASKDIIHINFCAMQAY